MLIPEREAGVHKIPDEVGLEMREELDSDLEPSPFVDCRLTDLVDTFGVEPHMTLRDTGFRTGNR